MDSWTGRDLEGRVHDSKRLEALLDKLVALRMDFEPVCVTSTIAAQVVVSLELITGACEILRSAVADVRNLMHGSDGYGESPPLAAALSLCERRP
jgi:hypothetical protein